MASEPRFQAFTRPQHVPYFNDTLQHDYCHADGEPWPCLHYRQNRPAKCLCSHVKHDGICWSRACGCTEYRPDAPVNVAGQGLDPDKEVPARFDERYDPSPEPIDRSIQ